MRGDGIPKRPFVGFFVFAACCEAVVPAAAVIELLGIAGMVPLLLAPAIGAAFVPGLPDRPVVATPGVVTR